MPGSIGPAEVAAVPKAQFVAAVAKGTGLDFATVLAWVRAEGGPPNNPLNILDTNKHVIDYGSPAAAAQAVVKNLHTPLYAPVIAAAQNDPHDIRSQLVAIAQSPWDAGHYTGGQHGPTPGVAWGTTLLGALAANKSDPNAGITALASGDPSASAAGGSSLFSDPFAGILGGLQRWLQNQAATGLAYVVLTGLGLALVLIGVFEVFGHSPREALTLAATGGRTATRPKPGEPGSSQLAAGDSLPF